MEEISKVAPKGRFRVIGIDSSSDPGWRQGDYRSLLQAKKESKGNGSIHFRIYNDRGECVHSDRDI